MADTKISALGNASALGGTEQIPAVQGGVNVKLTPAQLATYLGTNSGTYTPTGTNVANAGTITSDGAQWLRVGNVVTVSGKMQVLPTAGSTLTRIRITLPVASALSEALVFECVGVAGVSSASAHAPGVVIANIANDEAEIQFYSMGTGTNNVTYTFTYRVV